MNRIRKHWPMLGLLLSLAALVHPATAQHLGDVQVRLDGNQLVTENSDDQGRIYVNEFDDFSGTLFTDEPGFESQTGALPAGTPIGFNVLQSLWYWDGEQLSPPAANAKIQISLDAAGPVFVTGDSGDQAGFTIAEASSSGTIHGHPNYTLTPADVPIGVYGVVLELASPGYDPSESFLIAFNHGLDDLDKIDRGVDVIALESGVVALPAVPGDTDGDVDLEDLNIVRNHFGESGDPVFGDTLPFDGAVNLGDLNNVRNHFGATSIARAVPEPSSAVTCVACLLLLAVRPRDSADGDSS